MADHERPHARDGAEALQRAQEALEQLARQLTRASEQLTRDAETQARQAQQLVQDLFERGRVASERLVEAVEAELKHQLATLRSDPTRPRPAPDQPALRAPGPTIEVASTKAAKKAGKATAKKASKKAAKKGGAAKKAAKKATAAKKAKKGAAQKRPTDGPSDPGPA
jgi:hypothetical protein